MRKIAFLALSIIILCVSCDSIKYGELFTITDEFVNELQTTYSSYGLVGGLEHVKYTNNKEYQVLPIGRLINVRIEHYADEDEYEELRQALESHYSNDSRVNEVYQCKAGSIMIDCRN